MRAEIRDSDASRFQTVRLVLVSVVRVVYATLFTYYINRAMIALARFQGHTLCYVAGSHPHRPRVHNTYELRQLKMCAQRESNPPLNLNELFMEGLHAKPLHHERLVATRLGE